MNRPGPTIESSEAVEDFSLVLGGPLFQMFWRAYLSSKGQEMLRRRIIVITAISWLPLLLLSVLRGTAWGNLVSLPFLYDIDAHARFLISMPLLIWAEIIVHERMRNVARHFIERSLIPNHARQQLDRAVASANRLRDSIVAEVLMAVLVYGVGVFVIWRSHAALELSSWYGTVENGRLHLSFAGWWLALVSLPTFQFLLLRWHYRLFIWARFLWQVSRIQLDLIPTHPDRSGGLGFLANVSYAFVPLLLAVGALLAGTLANKILYAGARLVDFKVEIIGLVAVILIFVLGPLLVFGPQLERARRRGRREYGALAERYVRQFDIKWLRGGAPPEEVLIGSGDIQSLADLDNSYRIIREMKWVPFDTRTVLHLGVTTVAPMFPLVLTIVPFSELVDRLLKVVF